MKAKATTLLALSLLPSSLLTTSLALACGEGQFNMGHGLQYQSYLAPRPATVLVYSGAGETPAQRNALVKGLRDSGHKVTAVSDANAMAAALQSQHYDVLIADYADIDTAASQAQAAGPAAPALVPVVAKSMRHDASLHERFRAFVLDGASLGQYLKSINTALPVATR
jgi:CheY-like chemotaxis protein